MAATAKRMLKIAVLAPVIGFGGIVGWFFVARALSPLTSLEIRQCAAATPAARQPGDRLRIVTYNICHGRGDDSNVWPIRDKAALERRLNGIAEFLKSESPDLVVLNEVDFDSMFTGHVNQGRYIAGRAGFPCWVEQRDIDVDAPFIYTEHFGNVVLSRFPFQNARLVRLPAYATWEVIMAGCARAALCEIELPGHGRMRLLGTHLESRSEATRVASARTIETVRLESPLPLIVAGDLNGCPKGFPTSQQFHGANALSLLLDSGGFTSSPLDHPTEQDSTGSERIEVIDWILVPPAWRILSRRTVPLPWSDHRAVVMDVAVR
jgi:endonuclease/exonuclease/phosphatase family metal-dependent hydrolase